MEDGLTESASRYSDLDKMSLSDLLINMNKEDQTVGFSVHLAIPQIEKLVAGIIPRMQKGGRLFYIGAGTSGRLGIVDASECPPTFGVSHERVIGIMSGGDKAIRKAVEFAEDDVQQGWVDLQQYSISTLDSIIGIAASGKTPYVIGAVKEARVFGALTGCITCNVGSELAAACQFPIEIPVGPEFITGSTRMKAGTAQKLVLNMISTSIMIMLGHVKGNKMVDMQLTNEKLVKRGVKMIMEELKIKEGKAEKLLFKFGSVRRAIDEYKKYNTWK